MRAWVLSAVALAATLHAGHGEAQDPARHEPQVRADVPPDVIISRRVRLGLKVNLQARETDSVGAYVDLVSPGGPAAQAGLRAGDIITRLDGQPLLDASPDRADRRRSLPGLRLIGLAARLDPGDTVSVEYRRGAERRTTSLVTVADQLVHLDGRQLPRAMALRVRPRIPLRLPASGTGSFELPAPAFELFVAGDLAELELAPLNPDLGQYFGTEEGVLVVRAPRGSRLGVRGGDVVLAVDGRKPDGPQHLLRILRSYDGGEPFKLEIMRSHRRESLEASLPDGTVEP